MLDLIDPWPRRLCICFIVCLLSLPTPLWAASPTKVPVLLDTDIGGDIDDALALALALSSPEIDLQGITTVDGDAFTRALIVCRLLHAIGRTDIAVASGAPPRDPPDNRGQMQYGLRPAFRKRPVKEFAVEFLYARLKARPGELTLCAIGPLTNVADLLTQHPDCKPWIKRIVLMGGALRVGFNGKPPAEPEWNIKSDIKAARTVFSSGVPLVVAPLDATTEVKLEGKQREAVFGAGQPLANQLRALFQLWDQPTPTLFDPVALALCFDERFCKMENLNLEVDDRGMTRLGKGKPNARVATSIRREDFLTWFVECLAPGKPIAPVALAPTNPSVPVERGRMPYRVHVLENYETDIERRWWLSGQLETKNVPPGSKRACRGMLTNDFDDLQGDPKGMYTAVIFNPVPGPPMGQKTRLSFRCWLKGADRLRVQIYSLTNGYHRHLTLTRLPQGKWQALTVDLTRARRPDGSGGPLSENERIDDIQFYTDASAELIVDDISLYDAALPGEQRPFPERPIFTAWFDTGRQGKEWLGDFEIVSHKPPLTWKTARSIVEPKSGKPWLRLGLRGERPLEETTRLRFRYHLTGTTALTVSLGGREVRLSDLKQGEWAEMTIEFTVGKGQRASEVRFLLPKGGELLLDDVLVY
jgi:inosine-uridine nucleoside N-ribohydrolase